MCLWHVLLLCRWSKSPDVQPPLVLEGRRIGLARQTIPVRGINAALGLVQFLQSPQVHEFLFVEVRSMTFSAQYDDCPAYSKSAGLRGHGQIVGR